VGIKNTVKDAADPGESMNEFKSLSWEKGKGLFWGDNNDKQTI
jgi:hypothetical protein